jgi:hypothetical protein
VIEEGTGVQSIMPTNLNSMNTEDPRWKKVPRRFVLYRHEDVTGPSGDGVVAMGVLWHDGSASIQWISRYASNVYWPSPNAVEAIHAVHGHLGKTEVVWLDQEAS